MDDRLSDVGPTTQTVADERRPGHVSAAPTAGGPVQPTIPLTKDEIDMAMMPCGDPDYPDDDPSLDTGCTIGEYFAEAMGRADGCPDCDNTQPPDAAIPPFGNRGWTTHYICADCGARWTRDWKD